MKSNHAKTESVEDTRVLTTGKCKSVSGKAELSYEIGCDKDKSLHVRIVASSGGGLFSKQWRAMAAIESLLNSGKPINAALIHAPKQSSNNAGYLLAILTHLGLIKIVSEKPRKYEQCNPAAFKSAMQTLIDTDALPAGQKKPAQVKKKGDPESTQEG